MDLHVCMCACVHVLDTLLGGTIDTSLKVRLFRLPKKPAPSRVKSIPAS